MRKRNPTPSCLEKKRRGKREGKKERKEGKKEKRERKKDERRNDSEWGKLRF